MSDVDPAKESEAQVKPKAESNPSTTANEPKPNAEALKQGGDASNAGTNPPSSTVKSTPTSFDIENEFDLYLTLLDEKGVEKSSRLIRFSTLEKKAQELGTKVPFLSVSVLEKDIKDGQFCLKSIHGATFDPADMTLEEYAQREKEAAKKLESGRQSLTLFWEKEELSNSGPAEIAAKTNLSNLDDKSQFASQLKDKTKLSSPTDKELQSKESKLDTQDKIDMKSAQWSSPDLLKEQEWDAVLDGNQLFYAYHVPMSVNETLKRLEDQRTDSKILADSVAGEAESDASMNGTMNEELETAEIFVQALRPAYVVNPLSKLGSTKNVNSKPGQVNAGLFWSSSKSVASTRISKTMSTLDTWLLQSSYSKKSFDVGLSGGVKGVDLGGKFGFDSEKSQKSSVSTGKKEERLTAIHVIPIIDINLNETTLQLSPDCVKDIVRLRQDRRFADLKKFYEDYGTTIFQNITLGGRLYSDHILTQVEKKEEEQRSKDFKTQTEASLGIPSKIEGSIGYSTANGEVKIKGGREASLTENVLWHGFGGDPTLSVDPAKWRESVLQYKNWRKIKQDNAIKIEELISRFPGYEDICGLIDGILNSAVLDRSALVIPSEIMGSARIGQSIISATGKLTSSIPNEPSGQAEPGQSVAGGFSWRVLRSERDLKSELSANLQASLNISVNLPAIPSYLYDIQVGEKTMTVIFKWSSRSSTAQELKSPEKEGSKTVKSIESSKQESGKEGDTKAPDSGQEKLAQSQKSGAEGSSGHLLLSSITKKAWMVGIWHIKATETTKKLVFEKLSLDVYKYFSETRQVEEGCDYLGQKFREYERIPVTQEFKLLASDGTLASEVPVTKPEWGPAARASDMILRQIRLKYINTLPFRATLSGIDTTALWKPREDCLLNYQEAIRSALFLNSRLTALGIKNALRKSDPTKDRTGQENGKLAKLRDQANTLGAQWSLLEQKRDQILDDFDLVKKILTTLDELEVDLANLTEEETGDQQIDSDAHKGSKEDGKNSTS